MAYQDKTYVIFDGDNDMWAYRYMRGWNASKHVAFDFQDAHDLKPLRSDAFLEATVKRRLKDRFQATNQVILLIGEHTKNLYRFVRWEIETAQELNLPIIAVNLNQERKFDAHRCPPLLRDEYVVHVAFRARIIRYALDHFPNEYHRRSADAGGNRHYDDDVYKSLGITE
jgi:hypothetical protein